MNRRLVAGGAVALGLIGVGAGVLATSEPVPEHERAAVGIPVRAPRTVERFPSPVASEALVETPPTSRDALDPGMCGDLVLDAPAVGRLGDAEVDCLEQRVRDDADVRDELRALIRAAYDTDPVLYRHRVVQLASITTDPDLHYKLANLFMKDDEPAAALHHIALAGEEAAAWDAETLAHRAPRLDRLRTALCSRFDDALCDGPGPFAPAEPRAGVEGVGGTTDGMDGPRVSPAR